ncbi:MAG: CoA pyrophosphatase [Nitrospirae bacterium]|nr:CoA pyrophosphatase [Nitrospirota bacterium]MBI3594809.1 CoA pyrophosphatase [Nitrospirota bacterium]
MMYTTIQKRLKTYIKRRGFDPLLKPASVLLPLYEKEGEHFLLFTRRTDKVEHHKGQISFPGGMRDPEDPDAVSTAIRETWEEVGIEPDSIEILGELDDHVTVSGFNVTPFVGWLRYPFLTRICVDELDEIFSVPLAFFLDAKNCRQEFMIDSDGKKREFYLFEFEQYRIWGATAAITHNLIQILRE